jgi:hypothetical protein
MQNRYTKHVYKRYNTVTTTKSITVELSVHDCYAPLDYRNIVDSVLLQPIILNELPTTTDKRITRFYQLPAAIFKAHTTYTTNVNNIRTVPPTMQPFALTHSEISTELYKPRITRNCKVSLL